MANDDLINLYLGSPKVNTAKEPSESGSLVDMYLSPSKSSQPATQPTARITVNPVIGNRELTDADLSGNAPNTEVPGSTNRIAALPGDAYKAITSLPVNVGKSIAEDFTSGVQTASSGLGDLVGRPATGVGNIGLGLFQMAGSPITGATKELIEKPISELTGSSEIGSKAGLIAGSALPVAPAAKFISNRIPTNKAIAAVIDTVGEKNLPEVIQRLRENPRLSIMDVSLPVKQMGQKLVTTEGIHQNIFEKAIDRRIGGAKGAVENIYNSAMGIPVDVLKKINAMKQAAKDVGSNQINPAIRNSNPVNVSGVIADIDAQLKPGINAVVTAGQPLPFPEVKKELFHAKKMLSDGKSLRTDAKDLHAIQSGLRARADDLLNSANTQHRQLGYALMNVRNGIVDAINQASPTYKKALESYRDEKQIENAFIKGASVTRNRPGQWDDRPEFWNEWVKNASKEELASAREGARIAVDQQINGMRFAARRGTEVPEIEFNKEKLSLLFGKPEVDKMSKLLRDEKDIAQTNRDLVGNSQTAMRMKADSKVDLPVEKPTGIPTLLAPVAEIGAMLAGGYPGVATGALMGSKLLSKGKHALDLKLANKKNKHLSNLLTATGSERDQLIDILSQHLAKPKLSILQKTQNLMLPIFNP